MEVIQPLSLQVFFAFMTVGLIQPLASRRKYVCYLGEILSPPNIWRTVLCYTM